MGQLVTILAFAMVLQCDCMRKQRKITKLAHKGLANPTEAQEKETQEDADARDTEATGAQKDEEQAATPTATPTEAQEKEEQAATPTATPTEAQEKEQTKDSNNDETKKSSD